MNDTIDLGADGRVPGTARLADREAIKDLVTAYAYAVDDRDWVRWESLFLPGAHIDYTSSGGISGTAAELAVWLPEALAIFTFCLHTTSTHEIRFTGPDHASGRVHVFNRNGVVWQDEHQIFDVGAVYHDTYARVHDRWRFASRVERTAYFTGGSFADMIRDTVAQSS
jgi:hypothetical protein